MAFFILCLSLPGSTAEKRNIVKCLDIPPPSNLAKNKKEALFLHNTKKKKVRGLCFLQVKMISGLLKYWYSVFVSQKYSSTYEMDCEKLYHMPYC